MSFFAIEAQKAAAAAAGQPFLAIAKGWHEVQHLIGERVLGWIRRPVGADGFGFLNSDVFDGDLFFHERDNPDLCGQAFMAPVEFVVGHGRQNNGRRQVRQSAA